jgi:hypothetical protein
MNRCCFLSVLAWVVLRAVVIHAYRRWLRVDTTGRRGTQAPYW